MSPFTGEAWSQNMASNGEVASLVGMLHDAKAERDKAVAERDTANEYLDDICDAWERCQKIDANPPGKGITDEDYPGPTAAELEDHGDALNAAAHDLDEAIQTAIDARQEP